jgi:hypothetical protein
MKDLEEALNKEAEAAAKSGAKPIAAAGGSTPVISMNPDLSVIVDVAGAAFTAEEPATTGHHDPSEDGFTMQQFEITFSKAVDPYFRFDGNVVLSEAGAEVEEAYATTTALPWSLQARVGKFLTRFGRMNSTHLHTWDFVDQTMSAGRLWGADGNGGPGWEMSWLTPLPWYVEIVGSQNMPAGEGSRSFYGDENLGIESPLDLQHTFAAKQFFAPTVDTSVLWGLSWAGGPNATGYRNRSEVYGSDLYIKYRPISDPGNPTIVALQAEVFYRRRQVPEDVLSDVNAYAQLFYRFAQRWNTALRWEYGGPARNLNGDIAEDELNPEWTEDRHRVAASLSFLPTEFSRIRAQGTMDAPGWEDRPEYAAYLAKF